MRRLKALRIEKHLSIRDLAEQTNIHRVDLSGIESGRVNPSEDELKALGRALGCQPHRLLDHISDALLPPGAEARADARE